MVWSVLTSRVSPAAAVNAAAGAGCIRACSAARASVGIRALSRCRRLLTLAMNVSAALDELGEGVVAGAQIRGGGDQVGLRDPHRGLRPALGLRVGRNAGVHREPVVAGGGD